MTTQSALPASRGLLDRVFMALLPTLHRWCLAHVNTTAHFLSLLQQPRIPLLHALCAAASEAADSLLYMTLISLLACGLDHAIARKLVLMWCAAVYVANFMQDTLLLPRPAQVTASSVVLDVRHGQRYGLPCVKTLSATCLPFYFVLLLQKREDAEAMIPVAFSSALSWCFLVGFSRMDLGRNTPADVIAGHLLGHLMIGAWVLFGDYLDDVLVRPYGVLPWLIPAVFALCLIAYPAPTNGSPSFTETAIVLGWGAGWALASCWFLLPRATPVAAALDRSAAAAVLMGVAGGVGIILTYFCVVRFFDMMVPPLRCFAPDENDPRRAAIRALHAQLGYGASGAGSVTSAAAGGAGGGSGVPGTAAIAAGTGASSEGMHTASTPTSTSTITSSGGSSSKKGSRSTAGSGPMRIYWSNVSSSNLSRSWAAVGYEKGVPVLFLSFMCIGFSASFTTPILLHGMGLI